MALPGYEQSTPIQPLRSQTSGVTVAGVLSGLRGQSPAGILYLSEAGWIRPQTSFLDGTTVSDAMGNPRRRTRRPAAATAAILALAAAVMVVGCRGTEGTTSPTHTSTPHVTSTPNPADFGKPNIVFILVDDLDSSLIDPRYMPNLKRLLTDQGTTFANYFVDVSLCCPSRSSILRGQYIHNTGVVSNVTPGGGFQKFHAAGLEGSTIATWLQAAGYRTALFGKYLNGYPDTVDQTYIPPGWDDWASPAAGNPYNEFGYTLNENGDLVDYGDAEGDYLTDVLSRKTTGFLDEMAATKQPFFIYLATYAPHQPSVPAPRHKEALADVTAPRPPSFNEANVDTKPEWVKARPPLDDRETKNLDDLYRERARSMLAVDDMIGAVVQKLRDTGKLNNTYLVFSSDNGFHMGEHRLKAGKYTPYEEDIHVPLVVRGPRVPAGQVLKQFAMNIDLAPTFAEIGGASAGSPVDGRSLLPLLGEQPYAGPWRTAILYEQGSKDVADELNVINGGVPTPGGVQEPRDPHEQDMATGPGVLRTPDLRAIRTDRYIYIEYETGETEMYDLQADPYELTNIAATADPAVIQSFSARLAAMSTCGGAACLAAENAQ